MASCITLQASPCTSTSRRPEPARALVVAPSRVCTTTTLSGCSQRAALAPHVSSPCRRHAVTTHAVADAKGAKRPAQDASVAEVMITDPIVFKIDMPIRDAVKTMLEQDISGAPVVDASGKLVGVISESDVIWKGAGTPQDHFVVPPVYIGLIDAYVFLRDNKQCEQDVHKILAKTVGEAMSTPAISIGPQATLSEAASKMLSQKVNRLPVVDTDNKVLGVLTRHDVLRGIYVAGTMM